MVEPYDDQPREGYGLEDESDDFGSGRSVWLPRMMTMAVVVVAIGGFAGVLVYAYNKGKEVGSTNIPPIIKAGPAPHKIRPENPGGMKIANRDKQIYSRLATKSTNGKSVRKVERLLPMPEAPVAPPVPVQKLVKAPAKMKLPPPPPVAKNIPKPLPKSNPRRVASAAGKTGHTTDARPGTAKPSSVKKWPSVKALASIAPATGGAARIQIVSLRSEGAVRKTWARLQKRHRDLLGGLTLKVERRDLGAKKGVYYRLQAGPLATIAAAKTLCSKIKKRKLGCLIVRR